MLLLIAIAIIHFENYIVRALIAIYPSTITNFPFHFSISLPIADK